MTNKTIDGGLMLLYVDGVAAAYTTTASMTLTHTPRESQHKDDGRWTERALGRLDVTGSVTLFLAFADGDGTVVFNLGDIWDLIIAGTEVELEFTDGVSGDYSWSGPALFTDEGFTFGNLGETASGDVSFSAAGAWSKSAIT